MKNVLSTGELEDLLREPVGEDEHTLEPPETLLASLQRDIPDPLVISEPLRGSGSRRRYLVAASLFLAVVGAVVVYRVRDSLPAPVIVEGAEPRPVAPESTPGSRSGSEVVETARVEMEAGKIAAVREGDRAPDDERVDESPRQETPAEPLTATGSLEGGGPEDREAIARGRDSRHAADGKKTEPRSDADRELRVESPGIQANQRLRQKAQEFREDSAAPAEPRPMPKPGATTATVAPAPAAVPQWRRVPKDEAEMIRRRRIHPSLPRPSTGGTAEPNEQAYGDMFFRSYGTNPFVDTEVDALSTFGLDVDTGSYTVARSYLDRGHLPPAGAIRVEEFLNYFDYGDRPPRRGDFALTAEAARSPFTTAPGYQLVRFGLHARVIKPAQRKPAVLTFVIDVSGSMARDNRLGLVKRSLRLLLDELSEREMGDRVGLVVYGSRGEVVLEPTDDTYAIQRAIDRLEPGGSTNAEEGLVLGYELARDHFRRGAVNRVILCSDGVANVGRTGPASILARIAREAAAGIELTTVGFGMGNYNDVLMEQLADRGDGRYAYVDTLAEARRLFVEDLSGTLQTIASDAKVQVEFDARSVSLYRLLGYENRDIADERFRDDTIDAGEIGAGHQVSALYEFKLRADVAPRDLVATIRLRYRSESTGRVEETALRLTARDLESSWRRASPALRLASIVAEFAEILRGAYWAKEANLDELHDRARRLGGELGDDPEVAELVSLIGEAARLAKPGAVPHADE